uniref:Fas ligand (TNF superfamily, member 6) n=1 Tax=Cyprinus carpio carpio TaxID=630221 RepID=A0A8C1ECD0_CYPCA
MQQIEGFKVMPFPASLGFNHIIHLTVIALTILMQTPETAHCKIESARTHSYAQTDCFMWQLLFFSALGLGAYQILRLQTEVQRLSQEMPAQMQSITPQRQVGLNPAELNRNKQKSAAHLIGRAEQSVSSGILKWEAKHGEAFTEGIKYINGGLQVNETGLYFVYSRVEFLSPNCNPEDFYAHKMHLQRNSHNRTIMEDHREGFCSAGSRKPWMTGSHIGSLQHLKESDWLFVNVSHPHLLSKNYHSNYFGLFKIH